MARPVNKSKGRWVSSKYNIGYLEPRNGIAQTRICGKRQTTNLKWIEKNKKEAIAILEERIKIHLHPELEIVQIEKSVPKTLYEAIKEFKDTRFKDYTTNVKGAFRRVSNWLLHQWYEAWLWKFITIFN